ncbi:MULTISPECIES: hypothetical protein [Stenotrophomonas]|uniref:Uncharacterized protein n=1 Tax=Stenotrophomonas maltophilia TaxID=40324 RepID=A0A431UHM4_STEMA|nr:hypothetical protein [Stenotrophomonas maltophilia]RTQ89064.1 hypothetical protein EKL94_11160 [Stenotrophomonas maltophilia]
MDQSDLNLLIAFVDSEEVALAEERQGDIYPGYHYQLKALAPKAGRHLAGDMLQRFYFHWLRVGDWKVAGLPEKDLPALSAAYRELTQLPVGYYSRLPRLGLEHLFCFGFDENGELPSGTLGNAGELKQRARLVEHCRKYQSYYAQRDKAEKFLPYRSLAPQVLEAIQHVQHDAEQLDSILYWGMILVTLLDTRTRLGALRIQLDRDHAGSAARERFLSLLHYTAMAAQPHGPEDPAFNTLCEQLSTLHNERVMAGAAIQLVQRQAWTVENIRDWNARITLYQDGEYSSQNGHPRVSLTLSSWPDSSWSISLSAGDGSYEAYGDGPISNDLELPPITGANLAQFPQWIRQVNAQLGINLAPGKGVVASAHKNRVLAKQLDSWVRG